MDPKYEFRYTANANNAARAASLTGRGALNIMQSHWMVQTIPGLFAAQLATAAPGAPLQIDYLDVEWMFSKSILRSAWLDDQDLASWGERKI